MDRVGKIKWLARKAAKADLKLKPARHLFDALYVADALMMERGNMTKAASRAGHYERGPGVRRILKAAGTDKLPPR